MTWIFIRQQSTLRHSLLDNPRDQWQLESSRTSEHQKLSLVFLYYEQFIFISTQYLAIRPLHVLLADLLPRSFLVLMINSRVIRCSTSNNVTSMLLQYVHIMSRPTEMRQIIYSITLKQLHHASIIIVTYLSELLCNMLRHSIHRISIIRSAVYQLISLGARHFVFAIKYYNSK